jgi:catechol 2,3-dioxygenase-like lactoylglutathione lyase family enzyme
MERAARFYADAFAAIRRTEPVVREGPWAETVMATPGVRYKVCQLGLDRGAIELFEFLEPIIPPHTIPPAEGSLLHFGIQVDDVPSALARVEAAGGKRYWPAIRRLGDRGQVVYVTDPDGNIIELVNLSVDEVVEILIAESPHSAPQL